MNTWIARQWNSLKSHGKATAAIVLAVTLALGTYSFLKPAAASASTSSSPAPAAAPLDENSVSALLALDHAMETLAAHVTPAVVNVTVAARGKHQQASEGDDENPFEKFFGQQFGQQFGPMGRQAPQIEHGLGSGIIISPDGYIVTNNHVIDGAVDIRVTM